MFITVIPSTSPVNQIAFCRFSGVVMGIVTPLCLKQLCRNNSTRFVAHSTFSTFDAMSDTFAWGLGDQSRDESPTKRRRTATQLYSEQDRQQPTDSIPLAGLTRRNRTKTWPSSDARCWESTQQQPRLTKDSLDLSPSIVAALAKDLNLMEALVLSQNEMEARRHGQSAVVLLAAHAATHPLFSSGLPSGPGGGAACVPRRGCGSALVPTQDHRFHCL